MTLYDTSAFAYATPAPALEARNSNLTKPPTRRHATCRYKFGFIVCSYKLFQNNSETRRSNRSITISEFRGTILCQKIHTIYVYMRIVRRPNIHNERPTATSHAERPKCERANDKFLSFSNPAGNHKTVIFLKFVWV